MKYVNIFLLIAFFYVTAFASPAINKKITFTQPDGTTFEGELRGDASFHWIESNGDVVIYNPEDKYYYKAVVDKDKGLVMTKNKAFTAQILSGLNAVKKDLTQDDKETLYILYKKSKTSNHPR